MSDFVNSVVTYTLTNITNIYPVCGISHHTIYSSQIDFFEFCPQAEVMSETSVRLDTTIEPCMSFIIDSSVEKVYIFDFTMSSHDVEQNDKKQVTITIVCGLTSSIIRSSSDIPGLSPYPPVEVLIGDNYTVSFTPFTTNSAECTILKHLLTD